MVMPVVKVFTRENPCTKADIWECFVGDRGFRSVSIPIARSIIGANTPRYLDREGYISVSRVRNTDFYTLTEKGKRWLIDGVRSYIRNHPSEANSVKNRKYLVEEK